MLDRMLDTVDESYMTLYVSYYNLFYRRSYK